MIEPEEVQEIYNAYLEALGIRIVEKEKPIHEYERDGLHYTVIDNTPVDFE